MESGALHLFTTGPKKRDDTKHGYSIRLTPEQESAIIDAVGVTRDGRAKVQKWIDENLSKRP